jgi:uncharacterized protein (DUF2336 family)
VIIQAFLRWADTAKSNDRAKAANALGRAWLQSDMEASERQAALLAMTWLLDDPSPKVRLALAEAIADSAKAPRALVISLAADQPEIACQIIARSPVLSELDLVDLAASGDQVTRMLIASRMIVSVPVAAAIAEVGDPLEIEALLDNPGAIVSRHTLRRIADRFSTVASIRDKLMQRDELPSDSRHLLAISVSDALAESPLVMGVISTNRLERIKREACENASVRLASEARSNDVADLVEHLRRAGRLTPAFLMQTLCGGKADFFATTIAHLSGLAERRVRSILADGRFHAIRALYEASGLTREISEIFVEATILRRQAGSGDESSRAAAIASRLIGKFRATAPAGGLAGDLIDMVEKLEIAEQRHSARAYAHFLAVEAV